MTYKVPQVCPLCASAFLGDGRIGTMCSACSSPQSQLNSDPEAALACACDLLNTWCRESGVPECRYPFSHDTALRNAIDTLWATLSGRDSRLRAENEKLRTADIELTCARVEVERLRAENEKLLAGDLPDDAEPITQEWWWTIGGEHRNGGDWLQPNGQTPFMPLLVVLRLSLDENDVSLWIDDRIKWHELKLPCVRTRGDVRQLVKLLGRE